MRVSKAAVISCSNHDEPGGEAVEADVPAGGVARRLLAAGEHVREGEPAAVVAVGGERDLGPVVAQLNARRCGGSS